MTAAETLHGTEAAGEAVLGALLQDGNLLPTLEIATHYFERPRQRIVFQAVKKLAAAAKPIDILTVTNELQTAGKLEEVGGAAYVSDLTSKVISTANVSYYVEMLRTGSEYRALKGIAEDITERIRQGEDPSSIKAALELDLALRIQHQEKRRFAFAQVSNIALREHDWLIKGYLERRSVAEVYGDPNGGKTLAVLDMAFSIGAGIPWQGIETAPGCVFYILGEGQAGIRRRAEAWHKEHGLPIEKTTTLISFRAAALTDAAEVKELEDAIDLAAEEHGTPALIVFDTLARNSGGADENSTQDMNEIIRAADRLKDRFNACVLFIHHTGHADKTRARGSIALKGALDAEYRLDKDEDGTVRFMCTKMKDAVYPPPLAFRIHEVVLGQTKTGEPVTSAVLRGCEFTAAPSRNRTSRGKWQTSAVQILEALHAKHRKNLEAGGLDPDTARVSVDAWRVECMEHGMPRNRFHEAKTACLHAGLTREEHGFVYLQ